MKLAHRWIAHLGAPALSWCNQKSFLFGVVAARELCVERNINQHFLEHGRPMMQILGTSVVGEEASLQWEI